MADGLTSLASLNWGASTGGAAGAGETTLTLGQARLDTRPPPTQFHAWGAQITAVTTLLQSMTAYSAGGTRLKTLSQSSNPFALGEIGFWSDGTHPKYTNSAGVVVTWGAVNQVIAAAATLTIAPSSGLYVRINLSATAITSLTINAGNNGDELLVEVVEDGTGTRTIPTTWTNVAFAGGSYTATTTANYHDCISFVYNSTLAKWVETARALAVR